MDANKVIEGMIKEYLNEAEGMEQGETAAKSVLSDLCKLDTEGELATLIQGAYKMIIYGKSLGEIRRAADKTVASKLNSVI